MRNNLQLIFKMFMKKLQFSITQITLHERISRRPKGSTSNCPFQSLLILVIQYLLIVHSSVPKGLSILVFLRKAAMVKLFTVVVLLACKATLNIFEENGFVMLKCVMLIAVAKRMFVTRSGVNLFLVVFGPSAVDAFPCSLRTARGLIDMIGCQSVPMFEWFLLLYHFCAFC